MDRTRLRIAVCRPSEASHNEQANKNHELDEYAHHQEKTSPEVTA
jgi:hypothetical protein